MSAIITEEGTHEASESGRDAVLAMTMQEFLETAAALGLPPSDLMRSLIG